MKQISSILLTAVIFSGCFYQPDKGDESGGTILMNLSMTQSPGRTLLPNIDMEPASYNITGNGPNGAAFNISTDQETAEISGLDFGNWSILVDALNIEGTIIGRGTATATVSVGQTTVVNITVTPLDGVGSLDLTILWNTGDLENPSIEAQLISAQGTPMDLPFQVTGNTGIYQGSSIPTGYYTLVVKLLDSGILTMGAVEVVRIVYEETTQGTFEFYNINKPGGTIQVNIDLQMADPIDVTISGQLNEIASNESMTVTASVPPDTGNVVYVWYINGESAATGASYTINNMEQGIYRLDVTAFTTDGSRAGSASHMFTVTEAVDSGLVGVWKIVSACENGIDCENTPWDNNDTGCGDGASWSETPYWELTSDNIFREYTDVTNVVNNNCECLPETDGIYHCSGRNGTYTVNGNQISLIQPDGTTIVTYTLTGDILDAVFDDMQVTFQRVSSAEIAGAVEFCSICDGDSHNCEVVATAAPGTGTDIVLSPVGISLPADVMGTYVLTGTFNDHDYYKHAVNDYWIFWDNGTDGGGGEDEWNISTSLGGGDIDLPFEPWTNDLLGTWYGPCWSDNLVHQVGDGWADQPSSEGQIYTVDLSSTNTVFTLYVDYLDSTAQGEDISGLVYGLYGMEEERYCNGDCWYAGVTSSCNGLSECLMSLSGQDLSLFLSERNKLTDFNIEQCVDIWFEWNLSGIDTNFNSDGFAASELLYLRLEKTPGNCN